jgi:hypothetical protein
MMEVISAIASRSRMGNRLSSPTFSSRSQLDRNPVKPYRDQEAGVADFHAKRHRHQGRMTNSTGSFLMTWLMVDISALFYFL